MYGDTSPLKTIGYPNTDLSQNTKRLTPAHFKYSTYFTVNIQADKDFKPY